MVAWPCPLGSCFLSHSLCVCVCVSLSVSSEHMHTVANFQKEKRANRFGTELDTEEESRIALICSWRGSPLLEHQGRTPGHHGLLLKSILAERISFVEMKNKRQIDVGTKRAMVYFWRIEDTSGTPETYFHQAFFHMCLELRRHFWLEI